MLANPEILARLESGRLNTRHAGDTFTITRSGNKRRPEIVLATDRVGIEIYDVRTSRVLTSHGIQPADVLVCPPISVVVRPTGNQNDHERFTYWVAAHNEKGRDLAGSSRVQMHCLHESASESKLFSLSLSKSKDFSSDVRHLQINGGSAGHSILAVHADGSVSCHSAKLDRTQWVDKIETQPISADKCLIKTVTLINGNDVRSTILKSRPDILSSFLTPNSSGTELQLLAVVDVQNKSTGRLRYFTVQGGLREILSLNIPGAQHFNPEEGEWSLHAKSGQLHNVQYNHGAKVAIFDLAGLVPVLKHSLDLPGISSVLRLSSSEIAAVSTDTIKVINVKWQSLQSEGSLLAPEVHISSSSPKCLASFPSLKILVFLFENKLFTVNVFESEDRQDARTKRRRFDTLADAMGRGIGRKTVIDVSHGVSGKPIGKKMLPTNLKPNLDSLREHFDQLLEDGKVENYDSAVFMALQKEIEASDGGNAPFHLKGRRDIVTYAVSGLFTVDSGSEEAPRRSVSLSVNRMAPETFRFLLTRGFLTVSHIEASLRCIGNMAPGSHLAPSAVVDALVSHDPSLQALIYYLSSAPVLPAVELAVAASHAMRIAQQAENKKNDKMLTDGKLEPTGKGDLTNGVLPSETSPALEVPGDPGFEGRWPDPDPLEDKLHNTRSALGSCLARLSLCDERDICKALRGAMSTTEILMLVDYVRIELASGGWLARLVDEELEGEEDLSAQTGQVNILTRILNCAVDSLGSTAWILGTNEDADLARNADKIAYMRAETNAALSGIEESAALEQMLNEVLLFAGSLGRTRLGSQGKSKKSGSIVTVPSVEQERQDSMLPLGLKRAQAILKTKVVGGKEVPRSKRYLAWQEQLRVPEYSFERILI